MAAVSDVLATERHQGGLFVQGNLYVSGGQVAGNTIKATPNDQKHRKISVVAFLPDDLRRLDEVFVAVDLLPKAKRILDDQRFVVLYGPEGVGKASAGLSLLGLDQEIFSVDPSLTIRDLGDLRAKLSYGSNRRYLVETLSPASAGQLNRFVARAVSRDLTEQDGYLVFTVDDSITLSPELASYVVSWHVAPPVAAVLRRHISYYLKDRTLAELERTYDLEEVSEKLADRSLRQVDEVARALAQAFADSEDLGAVLGRLGLDARAQVAAWFGQNPTAEQIGFVVAIAVLGGCTYTTVSKHARRLEKLIAQRSRIKLRDSPLDTLRMRSRRVHDSMAVLESGVVDTEFGPAPAQTVRLESRWHVQAVLDLLWSDYDVVFDAVMTWLFEAGHDQDPGVRLRAAVAVGYLSQYDFAIVLRRILFPWALGASEPARAAADALGQAARSDRSATLALALLDVWASAESADLWWTAAVAYGGEVGVAFPSVAMDRLLQILGKDEVLAPPIVSGSALRLIQSGGRFASNTADHVLKDLVVWLGYTPLAAATARRCCVSLLQLASDPDGNADPRFRMLLLDPAHRTDVATLVRACLSERTFRALALRYIELLVRATDEDDDARKGIEDLLVELASSPSARRDDRERLLHYLGRWAAASEPSIAAGLIAERLKKETTSEHL